LEPVKHNSLLEREIRERLAQTGLVEPVGWTRWVKSVGLGHVGAWIK